MTETAELIALARMDGVKETTIGLQGLGAAATDAGRATDALRPPVQRTGRATDDLFVAAGKAARQQRELAASARLNSYEMMNVSRQLGDVGVSLASGMPVWQIAIQQGDQLRGTFAEAAARGVTFKAAMGGIAESVGGATMRFLPLGAAIGGATLALAPFIQGMNEANREAQTLKDFNVVVRTLGDATGYSAAGLANISERLQDVGYKADEANRFLAQMTREGVSPAYLERFGVTARDVSQVLQMDLAKASELVSQGFTQNASDILKLDQSLGFLSATERAHIVELQKSKREAEARTEAFAIFERRYAAANDLMDGPWKQTLKNLTASWSVFADTVNFIDWSKARAEINSLLGLLEKLTAALPGARTATLSRTQDLIALRQQQLQDSEARQAAAGPNANRWATAGFENYQRRLRSEIVALQARTGGQMLLSGQSSITAPAARPRATDTTTRPPEWDGRAGPRPRVDRTAENNARELEALKATAQANRDLAAAYGVSDEAALKAAATAEMTGRAIRRKGDVDAFVAAQMEVNASREAVSAARRTSDLRFATEGQERVNAAVAAGLMTTQQANDRLALEAQLRPIVAAAANAEGDQKSTLLKIIQDLTTATERNNEANRQAQLIADQASASDQLAVLELERDLIGAGNVERARQIAMLNEEIRLRRTYGREMVASALGQQMIADAGLRGALPQETANATRAYNRDLTYQLDLLRQIDEQARDAAQGMADAFGEAGRAIGGIATSFTDLQGRLESIRLAEQDYRRSVGDGLVDQKQIALYARQRGAAEVAAYGDALAAARGFFKEGSDGWRVLQAAEQAYRLFQFAMSIQAMTVGSAETASTIAQSGQRAAAFATEAIANAYRSLPFPLNLAAVGVVTAGLLALGIKAFGGGGGGGGSDAEVSETTTAVQAYAARDDQTRQTFASTVAQNVKVTVGVNDDRFNAYVDERTAPAIANGMVQSHQTTVKTLPAAQVRNSRQQLGRRGIG